MVEKTQYPSIKGRTVLITGGASGIGADLVEAFAKQGCRCVFFDIQDEASNNLVDRLADQLNNPIFYYRCDLADTNAIKATVDSVTKAHGPISVLINNAANDDRRPIEQVDSTYWTWSQTINVQAHFFMAQAVLPSMKTLSKGAIINLSSIAWRIGMPELAVYATAKAGILGLTNTLATDFGQYNIRVNAIEPGAIMTEKQRQLWYPTEADVQQMVNRQRLKHPMNGADVARLALFLASDDSAMITGQSIRVDAGFQ